ncbi:hypothetical protein E2C01_102472 [Portunus trituberculatus]|uniref:Uncharacterized protein n=1 Tax=Portunus trituberculatus TaxID=210409 RepID=A0A5B7KMX3_PORTR|nr:hypothetical protein [Portunus trituberculatus]
MVKCTRWT